MGFVLIVSNIFRGVFVLFMSLFHGFCVVSDSLSWGFVLFVILFRVFFLFDSLSLVWCFLRVSFIGFVLFLILLLFVDCQLLSFCACRRGKGKGNCISGRESSCY